MPTEEIFSAPKKDEVDGVLYASKPLNLRGNIVDGIRLTFEKGRIVDIHADQGEDILRAAIETDEGSHYLGEIALVPYDSPISNSGVLFGLSKLLLYMRTASSVVRTASSTLSQPISFRTCAATRCALSLICAKDFSAATPICIVVRWRFLPIAEKAPSEDI